MTRFFHIGLFFALTAAIVGWTGFSFAQGKAEQTNPQGYVEGLISDLISSDGQKVDIYGVSVGLTGNVEAERATVSDVDGVWLEITGFSLDWKPLSLLGDTVEVNSLEIRQIDVSRRPRQPPTETTSEPPAPRPVNIGRVEIGKILLAEAIAGTSAELTATGTARVSNDPVQIAVDTRIERTDTINGAFSIKVDYRPETTQLDIDIRGTDGPSGLVGHLLNIPGRPKLELALAGTGTLDQWGGGISLKTGTNQSLGGEMRIVSVDNGRRFGAALEGTISEFLPAPIRPAFIGRSTLAGSVLVPGDNSKLTIETLFLETAATRLDISGTVDPDGNQTQIRITAATPATETVLAEFPDESQSVMASDFRIEANVSGDLDNPQWSLTGGAQRITAGPDAITNLQIAGAGEATGGGNTGFALNVSADIDTSRQAGWLESVRGPAKLAASGVYGKGTMFSLNAMSLALPAGRLELTGSAQPANGGFDLTVDATLERLRSGNIHIDNLLTGLARITGRARRDNANDTIKIDDLRLSASALNAALDGEIGSDSLDLTAEGRFIDLSKLSDRAGGGARFKASLSGPAASAGLSLNVDGEEITLSGLPFKNASLGFNGVLDPARPSGKLSLTGQYRNAPVRAGFDLNTTADGDRLLSGLQIAIAGAELTGDFKLSKDNQPSGMLNFNAPDLSALGDFLLVDLGGALEGAIDIIAEGSTGKATIRAAGNDIRAQGLSIASLDSNVTIPDISNPSQLIGEIKAVKVTGGGILFDEVALNGSRKGEAYAVTLDASGEPVTITASALISSRTDGIFVTLDTADMSLHGIPVRLDRTARFRSGSDGTQIESSAFRIGDGAISIQGRIGDTLDLQAEARDIPLAVANAFANNLELAGTLSGTASISGSSQSPKAEFDVTAANATAGPARRAGIPPVGVNTSGTFANDTLDFRSDATGRSDMQLNAAGRIALGNRQTIDVKVGGRLPIALFADELARNGLRAAGTATPALTISGPVKNPVISGSVKIANATFGDAEGRFTVKDVTAQVALKGNKVELVSLEGKTAGGSLSASGRTSLAADGPIEGQVRIRNGRYIDGTLIVSTFDADLDVSGSRSGGIALGGKIVLLTTRITLDTLPPASRNLDDIRHRHPPLPVARQWALLKERKKSSGGAGLTLDLTLQTSNPILVRGRGINADFGGRLRITGTPDNITPVGRFNLLRGTLTIVGRRLEFNRGSLEFTGDINPNLDISATSKTADATVDLTISGTPDNPQVTINSTPEMPPEEALARLVFQQSSSELSPIQIARLADALLVLNGGTRSGLFDRVRRTIGIDRLDVDTAADGSTTVGAGRYLNDRTYIGAEQGIEEGTTKVIIDIDITRNLKLRTGADSDGETEAGIVFEKEY